MTFQVQLTQIESKEAFEKAVSDHIINLMAFRKVVNKPRPMAHPLVEQAIRRVQKPRQMDEFVPDYTFVDDLPKHPDVVTPAEANALVTLENKKNNLVKQVLEGEHAAKMALVAPRKQRLMIHKSNAASLIPEDKRTDEQKADMAAWLSIMAKIHAIELKAAESEAAIDDLTEDNIDSWQPPVY